MTQNATDGVGSTANLPFCPKPHANFANVAVILENFSEG